MIGISFLIGLVFWITLAVMLSKRIPRWIGITKYAAAASVLVFPLVFSVPFADEIMGRQQFQRLCEKEAVVWLDPNWRKVSAARGNDDLITELGGYMFPIRVQRVEFVDANTGKPFLTYKGFHTKGGFLMRHGLGLGQTFSCWPIEKTQILNELNIDQLLKQGK